MVKQEQTDYGFDAGKTRAVKTMKFMKVFVEINWHTMYKMMYLQEEDF